MNHNAPLPETVNYAVRKATVTTMSHNDIACLREIANSYGYGVTDFLKMHQVVTSAFNDSKAELEARWHHKNWWEEDLLAFQGAMDGHPFLATNQNITWLHAKMQDDLEKRHASGILMNFDVNLILAYTRKHGFLETAENLAFINDFLIITSRTEETIAQWREGATMRTGVNIATTISAHRAGYLRIPPAVVKQYKVKPFMPIRHRKNKPLGVEG